MVTRKKAKSNVQNWVNNYSSDGSPHNFMLLIFVLRSSEWQGLSDSERGKIGLNFADDGEFW